MRTAAKGGKGGYGAVRGGAQFQRPAPYGARPVAENAFCSLHGKKRSLESLSIDPASGQYVCAPKMQCKLPNSNAGLGQETETATCSVHDKVRSLSVLEQDVYGGFQCQQGQRCKSAGAQRPNRPIAAPYVPPPIQTTEQQGVCIIHHKARSWSCLQDNGYGTFRCVPPHTCKGKEGMPVAAPPVFGNARRGVGSATCSIHRKKRSMANLQQGFEGLECIPGSECKAQQREVEEESPETYVCSLHGKIRSLSVMVDDGEGNYQCAPNAQCKVKTNAAPAPTSRAAATEMCSLHDKMRSVTCLMDDGAGGMQCTPSHECK